MLGCVGERRDALAAEGLGQADRLAAGGTQMGVVHEAVNGGGGQGFRHQLVETGGVQVGRDGHRSPFVGGVDEPVEPFGGVGPYGKKAYVVDHHELGAQDAGDGPVHGVIGTVTSDEHTEALEAEPRDPPSGFDRGVPEGFEEHRFAGPVRDPDRLQQLRALLPCEVRVTSATHPLSGQLLMALSFQRRNGVLMLVVTLPDGTRGTIAAAATGVFGEGAVQATPAVLSAEGFRHLHGLVAALKSGARKHARPKTRK